MGWPNHQSLRVGSDLRPLDRPRGDDELLAQQGVAS